MGCNCSNTLKIFDLTVTLASDGSNVQLTVGVFCSHQEQDVCAIQAFHISGASPRLYALFPNLANANQLSISILDYLKTQNSNFSQSFLPRLLLPGEPGRAALPMSVVWRTARSLADGLRAAVRPCPAVPRGF